jgi:UDP-N-acetylglucosamine--N-acetylmuramyl-(pentapeptide) pyrophosphoryl-undecaprenol N-acetylglucosamine transferase
MNPIIITGGGSGGHFYPGLAVALALQAGGHEAMYVGAEGGIEAKVLPESSIPFELIPAGKLSRDALRPAEGLKLIGGLWQAHQLLRRVKPRAVLSTGGYAGFPVAFAAQNFALPTVIHEQNAKLGLAVRGLVGRAKAIALTTPIDLPANLAHKAKVTGLPVRESRADQTEAKRQLGLDEHKPLILILGGSQGSKELNDNLPRRLQPLLGRYQILHQCGARWESQLQPLNQNGYRVKGFLDTSLAFSAAEFVICRAGASTLAEAAFHQVPLLLIPLPAELDSGAQLANARFYAQAGGAKLLAGWDQFDPTIETLLNPAIQSQMRQKLAALSPHGATERLVEMVLKAAGNSSPYLSDAREPS